MSNTKKTKSTRKKSKSSPKKSKPTKEQRRQSKLLNLIKHEHKSNPSSEIYLLHKSNGFESIPPLIQSQLFATGSTNNNTTTTPLNQSRNLAANGRILPVVQLYQPSSNQAGRVSSINPSGINNHPSFATQAIIDDDQSVPPIPSPFLHNHQQNISPANSQTNISQTNDRPNPSPSNISQSNHGQNSPPNPQNPNSNQDQNQAFQPNGGQNSPPNSQNPNRTTRRRRNTGSTTNQAIEQKANDGIYLTVNLDVSQNQIPPTPLVSAHQISRNIHETSLESAANKYNLPTRRTVSRATTDTLNSFFTDIYPFGELLVNASKCLACGQVLMINNGSRERRSPRPEHKAEHGMHCMDLSAANRGIYICYQATTNLCMICIFDTQIDCLYFSNLYPNHIYFMKFYTDLCSNYIYERRRNKTSHKKKSKPNPLDLISSTKAGNARIRHIYEHKNDNTTLQPQSQSCPPASISFQNCHFGNDTNFEQMTQSGSHNNQGIVFQNIFHFDINFYL